MKKNYIVAIAFAAAALGASAQSKFDAPGAMAVSQAVVSDSPAARSGEVRAVPSRLDNGAKIAFIVTFADEQAVDLAAGYEILDRRDNMAVINLSAAEAMQLAELPEVIELAAGYENTLHMNKARLNYHVDEVHAGTGLNQPYKGAGVIVGMMDTGLDVNHPNFLDDNGNNRIKQLWVITGSGTVNEYKTPETIKRYNTDSSNDTHATHVLGIMTGSYNKRVPSGDKVATINDRGTLQVSRQIMPYYGVAPEAEPAPCVGTLLNANIETAAGRFADYVKAQGKPGVFNMSLGHNTGPHDGTSASNKYLAKIGKEVIICMSAGNEGSAPVSIHKDFTASDKIVRTAASPNSQVDAAVDVWSADATPVKVTAAMVDATGKILYSYTVESSTQNLPNGAVYITGSAYNAPGYIHDNTFNELFGSRGVMIFNARLDANNNRYNVYVTLRGDVATAGAFPAVFVEGQAGKSVDIYTNSTSGLYSNGLAGYTQGNSLQSINDYACGDNVISVGASINTQYYATFDGIYGYTNAQEGSIAPFSSWGKSGDRLLPNIVAPGMGMISSYNSAYTDQMSERDLNYATAVVTTDKTRKNYWNEMSGTSMASPFAAGVVALWLQADPTLTFDDVMDIMRKTSDNDAFTAVSPEKWGFGKINALAGIKEILGSGAVAGVTAESKVIVTSPARGEFEVFAAGAPAVRATLYNLAGAVVATASTTADTLVLDASGANAGVYVLRVEAGTAVETQKVVIR